MAPNRTVSKAAAGKKATAKRAPAPKAPAKRAPALKAPAKAIKAAKAPAEAPRPELTPAQRERVDMKQWSTRAALGDHQEAEQKARRHLAKLQKGKPQPPSQPEQVEGGVKKAKPYVGNRAKDLAASELARNEQTLLIYTTSDMEGSCTKCGTYPHFSVLSNLPIQI